MQPTFQHIASTHYGMRASTMEMFKSTMFEALSQVQQTAWMIVFSIHVSAIFGYDETVASSNADTFISRDDFHSQHKLFMPTTNLFRAVVGIFFSPSRVNFLIISALEIFLSHSVPCYSD